MTDEQTQQQDDHAGAQQCFPPDGELFAKSVMERIEAATAETSGKLCPGCYAKREAFVITSIAIEKGVNPLDVYDAITEGFRAAMRMDTEKRHEALRNMLSRATVINLSDLMGKAEKGN